MYLEIVLRVKYPHNKQPMPGLENVLSMFL